MNFELHYYYALVGVVNQSGCGLWHIHVCKITFNFQILDPPLHGCGIIIIIVKEVCLHEHGPGTRLSINFLVGDHI